MNFLVAERISCHASPSIGSSQTSGQKSSWTCCCCGESSLKSVRSVPRNPSTSWFASLYQTKLQITRPRYAVHPCWLPPSAAAAGAAGLLVVLSLPVCCCQPSFGDCAGERSCLRCVGLVEGIARGAGQLRRPGRVRWLDGWLAQLASCWLAAPRVGVGGAAAADVAYLV